jgi:hypothetical protein
VSAAASAAGAAAGGSSGAGIAAGAGPEVPLRGSSEMSVGTVVGISDIANEAGVSRACVCNWAKRWPDFPAPVRVLAMGPIYSNAAVQAWRERHGK